MVTLYSLFVLLKIAQSLTESDIGTKTYQQCADVCASTPNGRLAYEAEILAYLVGGAVGGDVWTPVADDYNEWLQIGGSGASGWDYGVLHTDVGGGVHGKPAWGETEAAHAAKQKFYCGVDEEECVLDSGDVCEAVEANSEAIDAVNTRVDGVVSDISSGDAALSSRIDNLVSTSADGDAALEVRIDALVSHLQSSSAKSFNGDAIGDGQTAFADSLFAFTKTELLLLCLNMMTIVVGVCICWRGGLFSRNNGKYAKVSPYYETDMENKPINS